MIPVHVGGMMMNIRAVQAFAARHELWVVDDAAHAFPAAFRSTPDEPWQPCGDSTAAVSCFSFYANKTITTGEGGMAVTNDPELAERIRLMSLHGLSKDAWERYSNGARWDYRIVAPGYKYNLTDIAAAIGIHQLARAEQMRATRQAIAEEYTSAFRRLDEFIVLPPTDANRLHAWHLYPLALRLERLKVDRERFLELLADAGVRCSVHWRPLHLHPYYHDVFDWEPRHLPVASELWPRLLSLPLFSAMRRDEIAAVIAAVSDVVRASRRSLRALAVAAGR
jgi:dTDP-4-amino-4,6-dideoxygalactose transaminase